MKSVMMTRMGDPKEKSIGAVELREAPMPEPAFDEVLIKVAYASICGSDLHFLKGEIGDLYEKIKSELPRQIGHEMSGTVEKVGEAAAAHGFKPGDKIVAFYNEFCNSCYYCHEDSEDKKIFCPSRVAHHDAMSEYVSWKASQVFKLPDDTDLLNACMTEPMSVALTALEKAQLKTGARVAIFGGGGIGLMMAQLAKMMGASSVTVIEPVQPKRDIALKNGADHAINPISEDLMARAMEITNNMGFDAVLESSGASSAAKGAADIVMNGGHVVYLSMYNPEFEMPLNLFKVFYKRGVSLHGILCSDRTIERTIRMLPRVDLSNIIQRVHPLENCEQAFADMQSGQYIKVVFKCN